MKLKSTEEVILWVLDMIKRQLKFRVDELAPLIEFDLKKIRKNPDPPLREDIVRVLIMLEGERKWKVLKIVDKRSESEKFGLEFEWSNATRFLLKIYRRKFDRLCQELSKAQTPQDAPGEKLPFQSKDNTVTFKDERWDRETGIWTITISEKKTIEIKLGKRGTETNETFFMLYSMRNNEIEAKKIRDHVTREVGKHLPELNIGSNVSKLRTWIRKKLGEKYEDLIVIHYKKQTKKYKLELIL